MENNLNFIQFRRKKIKKMKVFENFMMQNSQNWLRISGTKAR